MTAISVSERLLEMAAFYTPLALTVTVKGLIIRRLAVKCICLQTIYLQRNKLLGRENYSR